MCHNSFLLIGASTPMLKSFHSAPVQIKALLCLIPLSGYKSQNGGVGRWEKKNLIPSIFILTGVLFVSHNQNAMAKYFICAAPHVPQFSGPVSCVSEALKQLKRLLSMLP